MPFVKQRTCLNSRSYCIIDVCLNNRVNRKPPTLSSRGLSELYSPKDTAREYRSHRSKKNRRASWRVSQYSPQENPWFGCPGWDSVWTTYGVRSLSGICRSTTRCGICAGVAGAMTDATMTEVVVVVFAMDLVSHTPSDLYRIVFKIFLPQLCDCFL